MKKWVLSLMVVGALATFAPVSEAGEGCCPGAKKDKPAKVEKAEKDYSAKKDKADKKAKDAACEVKDKAACEDSSKK